MARTAEDYGIPDLPEDVLQELASSPDVSRRFGRRSYRIPGKYGEKGRFASKELGARRGLRADAEAYRAAVQRATYQQLSPEFSQGLGQITRGLAGAGPLADSGAANALRMRLAGDIYGRASGRIGGQYADYLGNLLNQRRQFNYQRQLELLRQKNQKKSPWSTIAGVAGGIGGALIGGPGGAAAGYGIGSSLGGSRQASDAYYG